MHKKISPVVFHVIGCLVFLALPLLLAPDFPRSLNIYRSEPTQRDPVFNSLSFAKNLCKHQRGTYVVYGIASTFFSNNTLFNHEVTVEIN